MKIGDTVWVPHPGLAGGPMHAREWRVAYVGADRVGLGYRGSFSSCAPEDVHPTREACEAAIALRAASEAVAKARDEVVKAAKRQHMAWRGDLALPNADYDDRVTATEEAARLLFEAECAEAEARVRLEALR